MSRVLSVSIPDDLMQALERQAWARATTKSELVREALRSTLERDHWSETFERNRLSPPTLAPEEIETMVDAVRADMRSTRAP